MRKTFIYDIMPILNVRKEYEADASSFEILSGDTVTANPEFKKYIPIIREDFIKKVIPDINI